MCRCAVKRLAVSTANFNNQFYDIIFYAIRRLYYNMRYYACCMSVNTKYRSFLIFANKTLSVKIIAIFNYFLVRATYVRYVIQIIANRKRFRSINTFIHYLDNAITKKNKTNTISLLSMV